MTTRAQRGGRQRWWWWALMGVICVIAIVPAATAPPTEGTSDDRLFAIAAQLKCQQCVGESVADSQSPSAVQFRQEIADQMAQGNTDDEILSFFGQRFEQEVLLTPPSSGVGALVWIIPVVVAGVALASVALSLAGRRADDEQPELSEDDRRRVEAALAERRK